MEKLPFPHPNQFSDSLLTQSADGYEDGITSFVNDCKTQAWLQSGLFS